VIVLPSVILIIRLLQRTFLFLYCQSQEETGSAGGQPVSNRTDAHTIVKRSCKPAPFLFTIGLLPWLKKLISVF
jgi:hypothetical protein